MTNTTQLREAILNALRQRSSDGMRRSEIRRHLGLKSREDTNAFRDVFRALRSEGAVVKRHRSRYVLADSADMLSGTISVNRRGFGFVNVGDAQPDVFVPARNLNGAISGDRVLITVGGEDDERGPSGAVQRIVDRRYEIVTGQLIDNGRGPALRPLRRELPELVPIDDGPEQEVFKAAEEGDWIVARLSSRESGYGPLRATFLQRLGPGNTIIGDLDAICNEYDLLPPYTPEDEEAAANAAPTPLERDDMTDLFVLTIDPEDAKDFDDALSFEPGPEPDTVTVGVHIADVAAYVHQDTDLDQGARERAFTAYLPGRTLPMLPTPLAAQTCSLREGERRPAHSIFLAVSTDTFDVLRATRKRTWITVDQRLSFDAVTRFLDGQDLRRCSPMVPEALHNLHELAKNMRQRRAETEAFLELAMPEVRVRCEYNPPRVVALNRVEQGDAHALVEEFMLAANTAVATELQEKRIPGLFRTHQEPKACDLNEFRDWAQAALRTSVPRLTDRAAANRFLKSLSDSPLRDVVCSSFLFTMQRAVYSSSPGFHYGLGKYCYCHFTSPIRRYPDLVVHQQLLAADTGCELRSKEECAELAERCSTAESNNDAAAYAAADRLKLHFVRELARDTTGLYYEGTVARAVSDGLVVYIPELGLNGRLPAAHLGGERFHTSDKSTKLTGHRSGKTYKCGDVIYVQIRRADVVKGVLILEPVQFRT